MLVGCCMEKIAMILSNTALNYRKTRLINWKKLRYRVEKSYIALARVVADSHTPVKVVLLRHSGIASTTVETKLRFLSKGLLIKFTC
jgi:hypothetical protein